MLVSLAKYLTGVSSETRSGWSDGPHQRPAHPPLAGNSELKTTHSDPHSSDSRHAICARSFSPANWRDVSVRIHSLPGTRLAVRDENASREAESDPSRRLELTKPLMLCHYWENVIEEAQSTWACAPAGVTRRRAPCGGAADQVESFPSRCRTRLFGICSPLESGRHSNHTTHGPAPIESRPETDVKCAGARA
jgi:hypothetical protein